MSKVDLENFPRPFSSVSESIWAPDFVVELDVHCIVKRYMTTSKDPYLWLGSFSLFGFNAAVGEEYDCKASKQRRLLEMTRQITVLARLSPSKQNIPGPDLAADLLSHGSRSVYTYQISQPQPAPGRRSSTLYTCKEMLLNCIKLDLQSSEMPHLLVSAIPLQTSGRFIYRSSQFSSKLGVYQWYTWQGDGRA